MPIYEFKCRKCGEAFEILFRSGDDKEGVACPKCRSKRTQRLMSAFSGKVGGASSGSSCGGCSSSHCSSCGH